VDLQQMQELCKAIRHEIAKAVIGQDRAVDLMLIALLARGHILLEGVPGTAKTLLAQAFSRTLNLDFGRIQFTPDLMPGDVIGTNLFNFQTGEFKLTKGPIFTQILLGDEINRTPPKTQAALLEAMQERRVTIDGTSHDLGAAFMVVATQNPVEQQGTYPLPEAQLDRFLFKHVLDYPDRSEELSIVSQYGVRNSMPDLTELGLQPVADLARLEACRALVSDVEMNEDMVGYVVDLVRATREDPALEFGASPRAASMLAMAARSHAALEGRAYAIPDDVKTIATACLAHRVVLAPGAEIEGMSNARVIGDILDQVAAPR